ncbi:hypothetical protein SVAN01_05264 [Stagonosporopsis vannaccii]|nr:hypothetical protein SVAN01_05264 [Stagonosporopsis vannaccii]
MPSTYTLISRPQNLSKTAKLIHRLRQPLRTKRTHHPSTTPAHFPSARMKQDKRRPSTEDESLEAPASPNSRHELVLIEDKGEYTQLRYDNVNVFWNSVMVESNEHEQASEQENARRLLGSENKRARRGSCGFANPKQLYKAFQRRSSNRTSLSLETTLPQQTSFLIDPQSANSTPTDRPAISSRTPSPALASSQRPTAPTPCSPSSIPLTWNSALTLILTSSNTDPLLARRVIARSRKPHLPSQDGRRVEMCDVGMVPNFSYPIRGACWHRAWYGSDRVCVEGDIDADLGAGVEGEDGREERRGESGGVGPVFVRKQKGEDADVSFLDLDKGRMGEEDSLYRAPTPILWDLLG